MAEIEIIDAEIVPQRTAHPQRPDSIDADGKSRSTPSLSCLYPTYTQAEREAALAFLLPSMHEVILGPGWADSAILPPSPCSDEDESDTDSPRRASCHSVSSSVSFSPSTPPNLPAHVQNLQGGLSDALLVRSCTQGWSLSFELTPFHPLPAPVSPSDLLISNTCVGLNPVDWKSVSYNFGIPAFPWILGRDIAGTVVQPPVDNSEGWKVGDRVWTCADSRQINAGAYQRFSVHRNATLAKVPDGVSDEEAATLGTGLITAAVALFAFFKIAFADVSDQAALAEKLSEVKIEDQRDDSDWILIYGGGAITGIYSAQLASISSLRVFSVASAVNFAYLESIGATVCIDRNLPASTIVKTISSTLAARGGRLRYAVDCVGSSTADLCLKALQENGSDGRGEIICLAGNPKAEVGHIKVHKISFSSTFYNPDEEFARQTLGYLTALVESGRLKPCRPEVLPDGLAGIRSGLEMLREGKAPRAKKLVVRVAETPAADVTHLGVKSELGWNGVV